jgi:hypothetical protein
MVMNEVKPLDFTTDLKDAALQTRSFLEDLDVAVDALNSMTEEYFDSLYEYGEENTQENEAGVQMAAMALDEAWASAQKSLSRYAVLVGIDGNEAFQRKMDG